LAKLRANLTALFVSVDDYKARLLGAMPTQPVRGRRRAAKLDAPKLDTKAIRAWAADKGLEVKSRGAIPEEIVAQYTAEIGHA
jgi:hypothetical protein